MNKLQFLFLAIFLLPSLLYSQFTIKSVNVDITLDDNGYAQVQETIRFYVHGDEAQANYLSGLNNNELSFWSSTTKLSDIRVHLNSKIVNIENFRIVPVVLKNCNDQIGICQGELNLNYNALPYYDIKTKEPIPDTGFVNLDEYKPRTTKYSINSEALFFETSELGHIIRLNEYTKLTINLPKGSKVLEVNPISDSLKSISFPNDLRTYSWQNTLLVKFSFVYEIEKGLDEEILDYFSDLYKNLDQIIFGAEGFSILAIAIILFAFYVALTSIDKKKR